MPSTSFVNCVGQTCIFAMPQEEVDLSKIFTLIHEFKREIDLEDFSVSQNTMEDVFLKFANDDKDDENDKE